MCSKPHRPARDDFELRYHSILRRDLPAGESSIGLALPTSLRRASQSGATVKSSRFRRKPSANGAASVGARIDITTNGRKMPAYKGKLTDDRIKGLLHDWCY
jgi:hypothetical protein